MAEKKSTGEILKLIQDFEMKHQALFDRMDNDFSLWSLEKYKLDDYSDNVTSTYPKFYAQAILSQLSGAKLLITVHRKDRNKDLESVMERGFYGWLKTVDEKLVEKLMPPLQSTIGFMAAIRGAIAGRVIYHEDVDIFPYDPRELSYGLDSKGIVWSAYTTYREPYAVEFEYGIKPKAKNRKESNEPAEPTKVIEWIDENYYQIIIDEDFVEDEKHDWERPPVVYVPVGSSPLIVGGSDKYGYIANWCESIYGSSRDLYPVMSQVLSICLSLLTKSHRPSYFLFTPDASMKMDGTPWGKGEVLPLPLEAKVQAVEPPRIAETWMQFYQIIANLIGQGDYPSLYYGQLWKGQELSGAFQRNLISNVQQIKGSLLQAMGTFYRTALKKLGSQYSKIGETSMVTGEDRFGNRFVQDIEPSIFADDYDLEIDFRSISPEEEAANYAKAQVAKAAQLASDDFIREKLIQYQDPERVKREMYIENIEKMNPKIYMLRAIEALRKEGKEQEARLIENEIQQAIMQQVQGIAGQVQGIAGQVQGQGQVGQGGGATIPPARSNMPQGGT